MSLVELAFLTRPVFALIVPGMATPTRAALAELLLRAHHEIAHGADDRVVIVASASARARADDVAAFVERDDLDLRAAEIDADTHQTSVLPVARA